MTQTTMSSTPSTFVVRSDRHQDLLTSPVRLEILGYFAGTGPLSIRELARRMRRPAASLYYHVHRLAAAGVLIAAETRPAGKRYEVLYRPAASRIALAAPRSSKQALRSASRAMAAASRMAIREFATAAHSAAARREGPSRNFHFMRAHFGVDRATLAKINAHLAAIERLLAREARRKKPPTGPAECCSLTIALLPLRGRRDTTE